MSNGGDAAKNKNNSTPTLPSVKVQSPSEPEEEKEYDNSWNTVEYWEGVAESVVRVTTAGCCGSMIGLAKERQAASIFPEVPSTNAASFKIIAPAAKSTTLPRRPPTMAFSAPSRTAPKASNLPMLWSIRCMLLVTILETSRSISPTRHVFEWVVAQSPSRIPPHLRDDEWVRPAVLALGDYTLGGAVAGLAGSIASRQRSLRFGLGTGLALGLLAGTLQAAMDVAAVYVKREQQRAAEKEDVPAPQN
jgi:hypothetical protein